MRNQPTKPITVCPVSPTRCRTDSEAACGRKAPDDNQGYTAGWNYDTIRKTTRPPAPDYSAPFGDGGGIFGSSHPAGVNALLADGSVRAISFTISKRTFSLLGSETDGQPLPSDW